MSKSSLARIVDYPNEPVAFLQQLLQAVAEPNFLQSMNLATVDEKFGVLNRTVLFRGLTDDNCVTYATQRFTRSYKNLKANDKCAVTFLFPRALLPTQGPKPLIWQVRLIGATAVELHESELDAYWEKDELPAQIRAIIFRTGRPVNYEKLKAKHDRFLKQYLETEEPLQRPPTFTAFKIRSLRWDFLKIGMNQIADRLQYRLQKNCQWQSAFEAILPYILGRSTPVGPQAMSQDGTPIRSHLSVPGIRHCTGAPEYYACCKWARIVQRI